MEVSHNFILKILYIFISKGEKLVEWDTVDADSFCEVGQCFTLPISM
jgi:hypothetical protein